MAVSGGAAAQKQPAPAAAAPSAQPAPGNVMGYGVKLGGFFSDQHKQVAKRYFATKYAKAKDCPEGMQRTGKTCKPPVEGRYWTVGQPLQKAVQTYPIPDQLATQLPEAPKGYEYVRAGEDILLVSKGMHLVVDMIQDVMS
jgi:Ni/Co efflux regulator RcnB